MWGGERVEGPTTVPYPNMSECKINVGRVFRILLSTNPILVDFLLLHATSCRQYYCVYMYIRLLRKKKEWNSEKEKLQTNNNAMVSLFSMRLGI